MDQVEVLGIQEMPGLCYRKGRESCTSKTVVIRELSKRKIQGAKSNKYFGQEDGIKGVPPNKTPPKKIK